VSRITELNVRDVGQRLRDVGQGFSPADVGQGVADVGQGFSPADVGQGVADVGQGFSPADNRRGDLDGVCDPAQIWGCLGGARSLEPEARSRIARLQPPISSHHEEARP
jgi:hypothetical protein